MFYDNNNISLFQTAKNMSILMIYSRRQSSRTLKSLIVSARNYLMQALFYHCLSYQTNRSKLLTQKA